MTIDTFNEYIRAAVVAVALAVVAYLAVVSHNEQAVGAMLAILAAAVGWLFRGKVQPPSE